MRTREKKNVVKAFFVGLTWTPLSPGRKFLDQRMKVVLMEQRRKGDKAQLRGKKVDIAQEQKGSGRHSAAAWKKES